MRNSIIYKPVLNKGSVAQIKCILLLLKYNGNLFPRFWSIPSSLSAFVSSFCRALLNVCYVCTLKYSVTEQCTFVSSHRFCVAETRQRRFILLSRVCFFLHCIWQLWSAWWGIEEAKLKHRQWLSHTVTHRYKTWKMILFRFWVQCRIEHWTRQVVLYKTISVLCWCATTSCWNSWKYLP